jgi:hypothetical protein
MMLIPSDEEEKSLWRYCTTFAGKKCCGASME